MTKITRKQLIKKFIEYFKSRGHKEIENVSLLPENDPTVLFTTAGVHPLVSYLLGQKHPLDKRLVNVQRCIRTQDIDEVGDSFHHTFFEMLGNWSLGDYWKKEAIEYSFEFLTKALNIPVNKLAITCFKGDKDSPRDNESAEIWRLLGIQKSRIAFLPKSDNWWETQGPGPCGPDTEVFYWKLDSKPPKEFNPNDKNWVEIGNDVLMQYEKNEKKAIVGDAIQCLINKETKKVNSEQAEMLTKKRVKIIISTNSNPKKIKELLKDYDFEVFSLEKNPDKSNPEYFRELLKKYNLKSSEVIYFDHKKENIESAKKIGILSELYRDNKQIEKFIDNNLYYYNPAKQKNIDFGGGVERTLAVLNRFEDNYLTEIWQPIIKQIEKLSNKSYEKNKKAIRIIADHIKASVFIIADGITPSNTEQGYVLRRLIRRAVRYGKELNLRNFVSKVAEAVFEIYDDYTHLQKCQSLILENLEKEEEKFNQTIEQGIKIFNKLIKNKKQLSGKDAFLLYQSYGFPIEMTIELAKEKKIKVDKKGFNKEFKKHQELSKTSTKGRFKSGLQDSSEETIKLHTATHLLAEALRRVLKKPDLIQRGSNITSERLRFDFNFNRKLSDEEKNKVEKLVNKKIKGNLEVRKKEMSVDDAKKINAQGVFEDKYGDKVSVYIIGKSKNPFSIEICAGPHVENTRKLGKFKILKEESSSAGVRRIKGVLD